MARITKPGPLTGVSGRIGNIVTYQLNGVQIVRALPGKKSKPKSSSLQKAHRVNFKRMHEFARSVKTDIIDRVWRHLPASVGLNPYNAFIKANRTAFGQHEDIVFPELLVVSKGDLYPAEEFSITKKDSALEFSWTNNDHGLYRMANDKLNVVFLLNRKVLKVVEVFAKRKDQAAIVPILHDSEVIEGYAFWSSPDDESFSPSVYWQVK